jgi:pimeloyl-ACP methyl ester carboxylesterase
MGMHALAIEVDPAAYRAVKLEAFQRRTTIPKLIGDILRNRAPIGDERPTAPALRWRRTGQGRRANQHTRTDVDDDIWNAVHAEALRAGVTVSRDRAAGRRAMNVEPLLSSVRVPTLVLHRRDNRVFDIEVSRLAAAKIRDARFVGLPGAETDLFLGDTRPVLAAIRPFLEDESSSALDDVRPLATVLFTDIVSSTEQLASATAHGDSYSTISITPPPASSPSTGVAS